MKESRNLLGALVLLALVLSGFALSTAERSALSDLRSAYPVLKSSAMPVPWTTNYANACDENWSGITCYEDHIVVLSLSALDLRGAFPASVVSSLTYLEVLELDGNQLTGSLPTNWSPLQALGTLNLWSNLLSGQVPDSLWALPELAHVDLYNNSFSGTLSSAIGNAAELSYLGLDSNKFTGNIPSSIGNLNQLVELWLCNNSLSGTIPNIWTGMSQLRWLRLDRNNLTACSVTGLPSAMTPQTCNITVQATPSCGAGCDAVWSNCARATISSSCSSPPPPVTPPVVPPVQPPPVAPPPISPPVDAPLPIPVPPPPVEPPTVTPVVSSPVASPPMAPSPPMETPAVAPISIEPTLSPSSSPLVDVPTDVSPTPEHVSIPSAPVIQIMQPSTGLSHGQAIQFVTIAMSVLATCLAM